MRSLVLCALTVFPVTAFGQFTVNKSVVNVPCHGYGNGITAVSVSGGVSPYTYAWSPTGGNSNIATGQPAGNYTVTITDAVGTTMTVPFTVTEPPALVMNSFSKTDLVCNGANDGTATISVSGGVPGYTYKFTQNYFDPSLGSSISGLAAGHYTLYVEDVNGCPLQQPFDITEPPPINVQVNQTDVSCNGGNNGTLDITPTGGVAGFTYNWSNGNTTQDLHNLIAGQYSVTVHDANNCAKTQAFTVTQPDALLAAPTQVNVACNGDDTGLAHVEVSGGTAGYVYAWSPAPPSGQGTPTALGLTAGSSSVTVTDAKGCTTSQAFTITQPAAPVGDTAVVTNVACFGGNTGAINLTPTGGVGPYTFNWNDGVTTEDRTSRAAGAYSVTVTDANGCQKTDSLTITQPPAIVTNPGPATSNVSCNGGANGVAQVAVSGGAGGYTYNWSNGGTTQAITGLASGTYTATVTDANNCQKAQPVTISQPAPLVASVESLTHVACNGDATGSATLSVDGGNGGYVYSWLPSGGTAATANGLIAANYTVTVQDQVGCQTMKSFAITQPPALTASAASQTDLLCHGDNSGAAAVTAAGGTGSYTYTWAPSGATGASATGLAAGGNTVTVTDSNNCTATQTFTLTQPDDIAVSLTSQSAPVCVDDTNGAATASATGGTGAFTWEWSTGETTASVSGLAAGTYTVTATDANACHKTVQVELATQTPLSITQSQTDVLCAGSNTGTASVVVDGGAGNYTYLWTGDPAGNGTSSVSGLTAGTYSVSVTDSASNCVATATFNITEPPALAANGSLTHPSAMNVCDGSAQVAPTGGVAPYDVDWAPNAATTAAISNQCAGTQTATVTDSNGCHVNYTANFAAPNVDVSLTLTGSNDAVLAGDITALTAHVGSTPDALGVSLSVAIPSGLTVESVVAPSGFTCTTLPLTTNILTCASSSMVDSSGEDLVINVRVAELFGHGTLTVNASATSAYNELVPANNAASAALDIISPSKLVAQKTVEAIDASNLRYTITVRNDGPAAALDLPGNDEVIDALPQDLLFTSASADGGTVTSFENRVAWNGTLRVNESAVITVNASINASAPNGTSISNVATVTYDLDGDGTAEKTDHSDAAVYVVTRDLPDAGPTGGGSGATGGGSGGGGDDQPAGCGCTSGGELVGLWMFVTLLARRRSTRR